MTRSVRIATRARTRKEMVHGQEGKEEGEEEGQEEGLPGLMLRERGVQQPSPRPSSARPGSPSLVPHI